MKLDGDILEVWFQDELNRKKVKLSEQSGKLAAMLDELDRVESFGSGAVCEIFPNDEIRRLSRVEQAVRSGRESPISCKRYYS